ncbi:MAG: PAAR domain-containing protein [Paracoccaceae bacterium]
MTLPQARLTDLHSCVLTAGVPAPILPPCALTVLVNYLPAARLSDMCAGISPHPIAKGSFTVLISCLPAARIGDLCSGPGAITLGSVNVLTG